MLWLKRLQGVKSLFDTAQMDIIEYLVPTMRNEGYSYYVAYSNTDTSSSSYYRREPDLYFVFSKEKITASSAYNYAVPKGSVRYICRSNDYSSSNYADNSARIKSESFSGNLSIEPYEHIYTNAEFSSQTVQPDILKGEQPTNEYLQGIGIILSAFLLFTVFWKMCTFRK